ncbi:MAG: thiamine pyrophosphokinase, partial [Firmicutes bacterium]|nr:thiamine pyrophosphokinase [Bacillota bacterium]
MQRIIIVLSGEVASDAGFFSLLSPRNVLVCADGGARHLHRLNCLPDRLVGDLDSIDPADLAWIEKNQVPIQRFPSAKDQTDAELAIEIALDLLNQSEIPSAGYKPSSEWSTNMTAEASPQIDPASVEIVILAALGGRPDHVLANQLMAVHLAEKGFRVLLSDGLSRLYPIVGPGHYEFSIPQVAFKTSAETCTSGTTKTTTSGTTKTTHDNSDQPLSWAVSAIPISPE